MPYSSLCKNFVTTAPVWLFTDIISSTTHQVNQEEPEQQINFIKNKEAERECSFMNGIISFSAQWNLEKDTGQNGDSVVKTKERKKSAIAPPKLILETDRDSPFLNFPFLSDSITFSHMRKPGTKVMFIMRGLPGSGKSTIVQKIQSLYAQVIVCSADDFFYSGDGVYHHDPNLLGAAHTQCQSKAARACEQGVPTIVIDNTNVRRWEMKFYADLGNAHGYVIVAVQPKTPWKWNPPELAMRNKHSVTVDILRKKVQMFDDVIPSYYAWFVNENRSDSLMKWASNLFLECLIKFPELKNFFLNELNIQPEHVSDEMAQQILSNYHTKPGKKSPLLHCTARFCGSGKAAGSLEYHKRPEVQDSCGRAFDLKVAGIIITKRTLGARITLSASAAPLFKNAAEVEWKGEIPRAKRKNEKLSKLKSRKVLKLQRNKKSNQEKELSENLKSSASLQCETTLMSVLNERFPSLTVIGPMRSAHFTLKTCPGVESKEVNTDILDVCHMESTVDNVPDFMSVSRGQACYFGDGVCCIYFDKPLKVKSIFSGYY